MLSKTAEWAREKI